MGALPPSFLLNLRCICCGSPVEHGNVFTCPACGEQGILDVGYDYERIGNYLTADALSRRTRDIWRYQELLPVSPDLPLPHLHIGWTPIYNVPRMAQAVGISKLFL
ncbi:MAG: threonine synthase, partial [bacterium]